MSSEERFRRLYAVNFEALLAYAMRRVEQPEDASDVVAETFLVAWRRSGDLPPDDEVRLWLYGVARRVLANHHRAGTRRERLTTSLATVGQYEDGVRRRIDDGLADLPGVTVHSRAAFRTPTLLLSFPGRDPQDAYRFLAGRGVNAPAGTFYALEASRRLGFGDRGALRVGLAPYTDDGDVDRLLAGLGEFAAS